MLTFTLGIVTSLKKYIEEQSLASIQLKREHTNEVTRIRKEMEQKQERERERLLNQIRELTKMKEQKNAKVYQFSKNGYCPNKDCVRIVV